jgi:hypothetical protein
VLFGTDSHTCNAGAFGQFATGIGNTDAGFILGTGKLLIKVGSRPFIVLVWQRVISGSAVDGQVVWLLPTVRTNTALTGMKPSMLRLQTFPMLPRALGCCNASSSPCHLAPFHPSCSNLQCLSSWQSHSAYNSF